jgi:phytoene synthase
MLQKNFTQRIENIIKKYGRGYYRATFLFPRNIREATWIYYTFLRLPDELVDSQSVTDREQKLNTWIDEWHTTLQNNTSSNCNEVLTSFKQVMKDYRIPTEYSFSFFKAMQQDLTVLNYATYIELESYMYGSAVVVGYTMSHIIGFSDGALSYAKALGEAFQMTNFLRDIREDYEVRGRIYLPLEDMDYYGVTTKNIKDHCVDTAWIDLMKFEINRTRTLYEKGLLGISMLHPRGRKAVYASALMYKEILNRIEKNNYDVFSTRAVVSPFRKTMILLRVLWKRNL